MILAIVAFALLTAGLVLLSRRPEERRVPIRVRRDVHPRDRRR
ncbi:hypothetical protein [Thermohalobaculum sediminis]|nr:hypothetical protein [Limibaculum sediminis]